MGILQETSRGRMKLSTELLVFGLFAVTICTAFPESKNVADDLKVLDLVNSREPHLTPSYPGAAATTDEGDEEGYPSNTAATPSYPGAAATTDEGDNEGYPSYTAATSSYPGAAATTDEGDQEGYPSYTAATSSYPGAAAPTDEGDGEGYP